MEFQALDNRSSIPISGNTMTMKTCIEELLSLFTACRMNSMKSAATLATSWPSGSSITGAIRLSVVSGQRTIGSSSFFNRVTRRLAVRAAPAASPI